MACKLHINIGGTPVSFELAGVRSAEEATNKVYEALSEIAEGDFDSTPNSIKESVVKAYRAIQKQEETPETDIDQSTELDTEPDLKYEKFDNAFDYLSESVQKSTASIFQGQTMPELYIFYEAQSREAHFSSWGNAITIMLMPEDKSNDPGVKVMKEKYVIHELIHSVLDKNFMFANTEIENLYNDIKKLLPNSETDLIENMYVDKYIRVREYLASALTEQILKKELNSKTVTLLYNRISSYVASNTSESYDSLPFYKFMASTEFEDIDKSDIATNVKYGKIDSSKVQSSLKQVFDEFEYNKGLYERVSYDATYGRFVRAENETPINLRLKLGRLQTGDIIYIPPMKYDETLKEMVPEKDSKYKDKYLPLVYSYFDKKKNDQVLVLAVKKKDNSYTTVKVLAKNVLGFRDSVGVLKVRKISKSELDDVKSRYSDDLIFSNIEKTSTGNKVAEDDDLQGNMVTISISKSGVKTKINKDAIEFRMGNSEINNNHLIHSLSRNSIISYEAKIDGKSKTIHAPLVRALAGGVELLSTKGEVYFVPFYKVKSVIALKEDMLSEFDYDKEYADESVYTDYYKNKRISHSNMMFTDNKGNFKSVSNSKYDYNQVYGTISNSSRKDLDDLLLNAYKEIYKENSDITLESYIASMEEGFGKKLLTVYLNRKNLLKTLKADNTYVVYDYIDSNNKQWTAKGKIVHVSSDMIYVYTQTKDGGFVQKINIRDATPSRYNPSIRRILYDNSLEYNLADQFSKQKKNIRENFEQLSQLFSGKKTGDLKSKLKKIEESNNSSFSIEGKIPTNLSDYYYYEYFNEDLGTNTENYKAFLLSKLQPGDIVFRKVEGYTNAVMVTSIDESTGEIIIANIISNASGKKSYMNGNMIKSVLKPEEIEYIGYNIYDNQELGIKANAHFKKKYSVFSKKISEFNQYRSFDKKETAEKLISKWKNKSNVNIIELLKVTSLKTNIEFYVPKKDISKYKDESKFKVSETDIKFGISIDYDGGSFGLRNKSNYYDIDINSSKSEKAFNLLKEGDVITMGANTNNWYDMVITNVILGKDGVRKYKVESFYKDADGVTRNIFKTITYSNKSDIRKLYFDRFDKDRVESNKDVFNYTSENAHKKEYTKTKSPRRRYSKNTSGYNKSVDNYIYIQAMAERLAKLYDVDFKLLTTVEITNMYDNGTGRFSNKRAFVIGNEIVINSDKSSIAEPLHELTHIILPLIKKQNASEYNTLLMSIRSHPDYNSIADNYPELSGFDLDEEVFCTIFGEYYAGKMRTKFSSEWNNSNKSFISRIFDAIKKIFANILNIDSRAFRNINDKMLMNMSLEDIFRQFGDNVVSGKYANLIPSYNDNKAKKIDELIQILFSKELITKECYE